MNLAPHPDPLPALRQLEGEPSAGLRHVEVASATQAGRGWRWRDLGMGVEIYRAWV